MATWTVYFDADPELSGAANSDLTGVASLDESSKPGDFDSASTINTVQIFYQITGSGIVDDNWDVGTAAVELRDSTGGALASITPDADTGNGNETATIDKTDSSPTSTDGTDYQGALTLEATGSGSRTWGTYNSNKMADGGSMVLEGGTLESYVIIDYTAGVAQKDITPAAETVNVTPGGLTVTVGSVAITPAAETVTATPGSLVVSISDWPIVPAAASVTATAGGLTVAPGSVAITPAAVSVTATAGGLTVTQSGGQQDITPAAATVTATPSSLVVTATYDVTLTGASVAATSGSLSVAPGAAPIVPSAATVTATPSSVVVTSTYPITLSGASVSATPSGLTVTAGAAAVTPDAVTVTATPGSLVVTIAGGVDRSQAASMESDAFFVFLYDNHTFAARESVGALNEINGTTDIGFWEARETYLAG